MMKVPEREGLSGAYHNIIYTVFNKSSANNMLKGDKLEACPLKSGMRWICSLSQYSTRSTSWSNKTREIN